MKNTLRKLISQRVTHSNRTIGSGRITKVVRNPDGNIYINVKFDNNRVGEMCFPFPSIFTNTGKTLRSDSPAIHEVINQLTGIPTCDICHQSKKDLQPYRNKRICYSCYKQLDFCYYCKKTIHPSEAADSKVKYEGTYRYSCYTCKDCVSEFITCPQCGKKHYFPERLKDFPQIPTENRLCPSCVAEITLRCDSCYEYYFQEEFTTIDGFNTCKKCAETKSTTCENCGKPILVKPQIKMVKMINTARCWDCDKKLSYEDYVSKILKDLNSPSIKKMSLTDFNKTPHTELMNNLSHCPQTQPAFIYNENLGVCEPAPKKDVTKYFLDAVLVDAGPFSLVLVYPNHDKPEYVHIWERAEGSAIMSDVKKQMKLHDWQKIVSEREYTEIPVNNHLVFRSWAKPFVVHAMTDNVRHYGKNRDQFGDTESFYIIGTLHQHY